MYREVEVIWQNDAGADSWDEPNDGRRIFWTPKRNNPAGDRYDGVTIPAQNNAVDTFRGGPGMRREHIHEINVAGFDELMIQWSGECVSSSGFGIDTGGGTQARSMWADAVWGWAAGLAYVDSSLALTKSPPVVVHSSAEEGTQAAPMVNDTAGGGSTTEPMLWAGTNKLHVQMTGYGFNGFADPSNYFARGWPVTVPFDATCAGVGDAMCRGGLFWGYTQIDAGPTDVSRLPAAGDRYGFLAKIGWPSGAWANTSGQGSAAMHTADVRVTGLDRVFCAFFSTASLAGEKVTFNNGPGNSHVVKGRLYAVKTAYGPSPGQTRVTQRGN